VSGRPNWRALSAPTSSWCARITHGATISVWAGLHWRSSVVAGEELGDSVAGWSLSHYFGSLGARSRQRRLMSAGCAAVTAAQPAGLAI